MNQVITQFEVCYEDVRNQWIPDDANVIYEDSPDMGHTVIVYAWKNKLNVMRFFIVGGKWVASHDFCEHPLDIRGLS
jgi:hypothetical protein